MCPHQGEAGPSNAKPRHVKVTPTATQIGGSGAKVLWRTVISHKVGVSITDKIREFAYVYEE